MSNVIIYKKTFKIPVGKNPAEIADYCHHHVHDFYWEIGYNPEIQSYEIRLEAKSPNYFRIRGRLREPDINTILKTKKRLSLVN